MTKTKAKASSTLSPAERDALIGVLKARFERYPERHRGMAWGVVEARLLAKPAKLWSLSEMERTGGEPDVVGRDEADDAFLFMDCSPESPAGRTAVCYDREGLESRKEHKPKTSALDLAAALGVELLSEDQYRALQQVGEFDRKSSSWLKTPAEVRALGGALFGDRRYRRVFIYHNGAQSYHSGRGFRGLLRV